MVLSFCIKKTTRGCFVVVSHTVGMLGLLSTVVGLVLGNNLAIVAGLTSHSIFTFPSFPVVLQAVGKRVGKNFDLVATASIFMQGHTVSALLFAVNLAFKISMQADKFSLTAMMSILCAVAALSTLLLARGYSKMAHPFKMRLPSRAIV